MADGVSAIASPTATFSVNSKPGHPYIVQEKYGMEVQCQEGDLQLRYSGGTGRGKG